MIGVDLGMAVAQRLGLGVVQRLLGLQRQTVRVHAITSCLLSVGAPDAQSLFQFFDPGEQFAREHRARVVEAEVHAKSRRAREQARILAPKQRRGDRPAARLDQPERYEPGDDLRMEAGLTGEGRQARSARALASRASRLGGAASRRPSAALSRIELRHVRQLLKQLAFVLGSRLGTCMASTAYRFPAGPLAFGRPSPRSRKRRPLEEPAGTRTRALPESVLTGTSGQAPPPKVKPADRHTDRVPRRESSDAVSGERAGTDRRAGRRPCRCCPVRPAGSVGRRATPRGIATSKSRPLPSDIRRLPPAAASSSVSSSTASWSPPGIENPLAPEPAVDPQPWRPRRPKRPSKRSLKSPSPKSTRTSPKPAPLRPRSPARSRARRTHPGPPSSSRRVGRSGRASRRRAEPRRPRRSA